MRVSLLRQSELSHPPLEPPPGDLERLDHGVEISPAPRPARLDLLAGQVRGLPDALASLDSIVERPPGHAELRGGPLDTPAVRSQRLQELVVGDLLRAAVGL